MTARRPVPGSLPPLDDLDRFAETRRAWHAVAEHVLAAARHRAEGRIGLVATPGGFGIPAGSAGPSARVEGATLLVEGPGPPAATALTTIAAAAAALGIEPGAPTEVFAPTTPLTPDAPLVVDPGAADVLAAWFALGWDVLDALHADATPDEAASAPTLWPEHFDVAIELGAAARDALGTFGVSPGDAEHAEPYLYVTHWSDVPADPYWNDTAFPGASRSYRAVAATSDAATTMREFFERGRATLASGGG